MERNGVVLAIAKVDRTLVPVNSIALLDIPVLAMKMLAQNMGPQKDGAQKDRGESEGQPA